MPSKQIEDIYNAMTPAEREAKYGKRDGRNHCRASPPFKVGSKPVTVHMGADDYRLLYEQAMQRGISVADTLRQLVREAAQ